MGRTQFTFYESFFKSLQRIRKKSDRADAYDAMCSYALYGTEPDLDKLPDSAAVAFMLIKPNLDASKRKAESGKRGGTAKQTASEKEKEKEKEGEKENECYPPTPLRGARKQERNAPTFEQVLEAAKLRGCPDLARGFFDYYDAAGWRDGEGKPVYNWQQKLVAWQMRERQREKPQEPWRYDPGSLEGSL